MILFRSGLELEMFGEWMSVESERIDKLEELSNIVKRWRASWPTILEDAPIFLLKGQRNTGSY